MTFAPFKLERYFAQYEFDAPYLLSPSDSEPLTLSELLALASDERRQAWDNLWLGYTDSQGHPELRALIADMYTDGIAADNILQVVPEEGIFILMNTLLSEGDHVICTAPAFQSLYSIAEGLGCHVDKWLPNPTSDGWHFDLNTLTALIQPNTRLIVGNFPHNPTGALPTHDEWSQIIQIAADRDIILFSDEMYRWSEHNPTDCLPSACEVYENAITLSGLSKTFSLPGLRLGWLVSQNPDLIARFQGFKDYTTICGSAPSEALALIALDNYQTLATRTREIIHANLNLLDAFFTRHTNRLRWRRPKAGTVAFVELLADENVSVFADAAVESHGVMIVPANILGHDGNFFRLGFGRRNLPDVLAQFEAFLLERYP